MRCYITSCAIYFFVRGLTVMIMNAQNRQSGRQRPEAQPYSPQDLRDLAAALVAAGGSVAEAADALETAAKGALVRINYTQSVMAGLRAVKLLIGDVDKKITQEKFSFPGTGVELPQTTRRIPTPTPGKTPKTKRTN